MTKEEAIKILEGAIKKPNTQDGYLGQALTMAIAALSAEPCEDAISRQAIRYLSYDISEIDGEHYKEPHYVVDFDDIEKLPSVQPIRPHGHWILVSDKTPGGYWKCSECLMHKRMPSGRLDSFCSCCGADMRESEGRA